MKKNLQSLKEATGGLLGSLCEIVIGVLLLVNPTLFTSTIIIIVGCVLLLMGLAGIVSYFRTEPAQAAKEQSFVKGLLLAIVGVFCAARSDWFIATFPVITKLYGVAILAVGVSKVQWTLDSVRMKKDNWLWQALSAAVTLVCAGVILANPFGTVKVLWIFIGVSLIVEAVVDILAVLWKKPDGQK